MIFYPADYSKIDSEINTWARKHTLYVSTIYNDADVRSVQIVDNSGKQYQIWIDAPNEENEVMIHAWDYKRRKIETKSSFSELGKKLEEIYVVVLSWE